MHTSNTVALNCGSLGCGQVAHSLKLMLLDMPGSVLLVRHLFQLFTGYVNSNVFVTVHHVNSFFIFLMGADYQI